tara:strand:+ start:1951 stop:2544 length:594 start_codon:yes stop_codon:yes gene_type:complete
MGRGRVAIGIIIASLCFGSTANAHLPDVDWNELEKLAVTADYEWNEQSAKVAWLQFLLKIPMDSIYGPLTLDQHLQRANLLELDINAPEAVIAVFEDNVERWRDDVVEAIERYGGPATDVTRFLRVMRCESMGYPDVSHSGSGASGLMQHLPQYWDARARSAGYGGASVFDPIANINVSAWLLYQASGGGWQHWVCR